MVPSLLKTKRPFPKLKQEIGCKTLPVIVICRDHKHYSKKANPLSAAFMNMDFVAASSWLCTAASPEGVLVDTHMQCNRSQGQGCYHYKC